MNLADDDAIGADDELLGDRVIIGLDLELDERAMARLADAFAVPVIVTGDDETEQIRSWIRTRSCGRAAS